MGRPRAQLQDVSKCLRRNASFWGRGEGGWMAGGGEGKHASVDFVWFFVFVFVPSELRNSPRRRGLSQLSAPPPGRPPVHRPPQDTPLARFLHSAIKIAKMPLLKAAPDWPFRRRRQSARETFNLLSGFISKGPDEGEHKLIDHCFPGKRSCIRNE